MNKREKFLKEIAEVINRNSLEAHFNDTPDYILAKVAAEAMENFAEASDMKPVEFPGVNVVFAKDQPEYVPLPAMKVPDDPQGLIITKWELSPDELKRIQETGTIHLSVLTFNQPLQPVLLTVDLPTE